jgi:chorismate synthase
MAGNSFGDLFRITTYGESHGPALGVIIDGCPAGLSIDSDFIQNELDRRRPGQSKIVTQRKESDSFEILSGVFEGKATGAPMSFMVRNENQKSTDYEHIKNSYRPSHADFTYQEKYGHRDYRGGGRSSARETVARVIGGAVAKLILKKLSVEVIAFVSQVGHLRLDTSGLASGSMDALKLTFKNIETTSIRCPDLKLAEEMIACIDQIRKSGDTIGGVITTVITGVPVGWGEPAFNKLHADLGKAMLSINACKGFEYGSGFDGVSLKGSEHNDAFYAKENKIGTTTNYSGGIQGGISNGEDIYFRVAFKPVATIMQNQNSVNRAGETIEVMGKGRHDPCVLPRAVPIVESMAALVLVDHYLKSKTISL